MYQLAGFKSDFLYADINDGIDYERAVEVLNQRAGKAFRHYFQAMHAANVDVERVERLYDTYRAAQQAGRELSPRDAKTIALILAQPNA